jgi:hypothetical protein
LMGLYLFLPRGYLIWVCYIYTWVLNYIFSCIISFIYFWKFIFSSYGFSISVFLMLSGMNAFWNNFYFAFILENFFYIFIFNNFNFYIFCFQISFSIYNKMKYIF